MKQKTEEKEKLTDEEIIDALCLRLIKGDSVSALCKDLSISEVQLFGYINQLKSNNVNVSLTNKAGDIILAINNSPDYTKENSFTIESNDKTLAETTKIGVISDLRFGSKSEQIALLNDMYKKFASDGVKYVIVAGNLLEGKYNSKDEKKQHDMLACREGIVLTNMIDGPAYCEYKDVYPVTEDGLKGNMTHWGSTVLKKNTPYRVVKSAIRFKI